MLLLVYIYHIDIGINYTVHLDGKYSDLVHDPLYFISSFEM